MENRLNTFIEAKENIQIKNGTSLGTEQCDQMAILRFQIWLITAIKLYQYNKKFAQSRFKSLPNTKEALTKLQKTYKTFCQSGEFLPNLITLVRG